MGIKNKILILIVLSILIISLLIGTVIISSTRNTFKAETIEKLQYLTYGNALEFDHRLENVEDIAEELERLVEVNFDVQMLEQDDNYLYNLEDLLEPAVKEIADKGIDTKSAYIFFDPVLDGKAHDVWFTDLNHDGEITRQETFPIEFYESYEPGEEWYFVPKETRRPYWTNPYYGSAEYDKDILFVSYIRPLVVNDTFIGIVGSDFHYEYLKESIEKINLNEKGYAVLVNQMNEVLLHPTVEVGKSLSDIYAGQYIFLANEFSKNTEGTLEYKWIDDQKKILIYKRLINGWTFAITMNEKDIFSWITTLTKVIIVIIIVAIAITTFVTSIIGKQITRPLEELQNYVKKIGDGNYDQTIPVEYQRRLDETGGLARSIETMRLLQKKAFEQITDYSTTLEKKVLERTENLSETNFNLERIIAENNKKTDELIDLNAQLGHAMEVMTQTQIQLIETEKQASINILITKIAHDFNTPVGNMVTLLSFLNNKNKLLNENFQANKISKSALTEYFSAYDETMEIIQSNLNIIGSLMNRFKELDPTNILTVLSTINIKSFIEVVIQNMHLDWTSIQYEIICEDVEITIDSGKLSQVLIHLLENAYRHAFVGLEEGLIIIDIRVKDDLLYIDIKDNGIGMSEEKIRNIFSPFYSGELNSEFSGLGLNIAYNLVNNVFRGKIICNSIEGHGTSFELELNLV